MHRSSRKVRLSGERITEYNRLRSCIYDGLLFAKIITKKKQQRIPLLLSASKGLKYLDAGKLLLLSALRHRTQPSVVNQTADGVLSIAITGGRQYLSELRLQADL